jgi:hypothetical protein
VPLAARDRPPHQQRRRDGGAVWSFHAAMFTGPAWPRLGCDLGRRPSHRPGEGQVTALTLVLTRPARPARSERTRP